MAGAMSYKFGVRALASAGALSFLCTAADAQWAPQFYAGIGGGYALGPDRFAYPFGVNGSQATFDRRDLGGFSPFGYVGTRVHLGGVFVGLEAEYMRRSANANYTLSSPGYWNTPVGTIGGYSATFETDISDRVSLSAVVSVPIRGIEGYVRAGLGYSELQERYKKSNNGPSSYSSVCYPPTWQCSYTYYYADPIDAKRSKDVISPILAAGVQIPLGNFFVRAEAEVEFLSLPTNDLPVTEALRSSDGQILSSGSGSVRASSTPALDANLRLSASVGAKF